MPKFVCIKTESDSVPLGTVIEGSICMYGGKVRILVSEDSEVKLPNGSSFFRKGVNVPLKGDLWEWQEDVLDVLDRFEEAVRKQEQFLSDINHYGESELSYVETGNECKAAKADLLKALGK